MAWGFLDQHHTIVGERFDPTYGEQAATDALREFVVRALGTERARTVDVRPVCDLPERALLEAGSAADLLVVGARGLGGFRGLLLGSVSQHCLHHTTTPIAIIRPVDAEHETSGRIVVAVDGSPTSHRALQWAMVESRARDVTLDVVHAWQVPYAGYLPFGSTRPDDADAYEDAATQLLERMIASAGGETRTVPALFPSAAPHPKRSSAPPKVPTCSSPAREATAPSSASSSDPSPPSSSITPAARSSSCHRTSRPDTAATSVTP
jgi:nucleotide-binding universal stress UspA family protein